MNAQARQLSGSYVHPEAAPAFHAAIPAPFYSATVTNLLLHGARSQIRMLEEKLEQMSKLAHEDQLTGILNRRGCNAALARELSRTGRQNNPLCIALLDIDNFKRINDEFGHAAGDQALIHLVQVVSGALRATDIFARLGGEEFLLVLPDTTIEQAYLVVSRLQKALSEARLNLCEKELFLQFSAGIAQFQAGEEASSLIHRADMGTSKAKRNGKNCIAIH